MKKILEFLGIRKLTTKTMCTLGVFIALAVVFDILFTIPISQSLQISFSYIPIFVIAALYGPFFGGITYVISDALSAYILYGSVSPLLSITAFLSGFVFGLFFYKKYNPSTDYIVISVSLFGKRFHKRFNFSLGFMVRVIICVILQFVISLFLNTYLLTIMYNFIYIAKVIERLPTSLLKLVVQTVVFSLSPAYLRLFNKLSK